jgi:hypothetical protein
MEGGKGGEIIQTLYSHMNIIKKEKNYPCYCLTLENN